MGIQSSPHFGARFGASKHATPELALLLEAADELASLDAMELLPASVVDLLEALTPATTLPTSPGSEEWQEDYGEGPTPAHWWAAGASKYQGHGQGVPVPLQPTQAPPLGPIMGAVQRGGGYIPMWCWTQNVEDGQLLIAPFADGAADELPDLPALPAECTCVKLWCWAQADAAGNLLVVPCTNEYPGEQQSAAEARPEEALDAAVAEPEWAPPPPPAGSHVPSWVPGPCWPFNAAPTTLTVSDLPEELTQEEFLEVLDREEFSGFYDFVFLPSAPEPGQTQRRAVVNLTKHAYALALAARLHGRVAWGGGRRQPCTVEWSLPAQGLPALVRTYREVPENHPDTEEHLRPQLFRKGWPAPLPPPMSGALADVLRL